MKGGAGLLASLGGRPLACAISVVVFCFGPPTAASQESRSDYVHLLAAYKKGDVEGAVAGVKRLTSSAERTKTLTDWVADRRRSKDVASLELALMLHTEAAIIGFGEGAALGLSGWLNQLGAVRRVFVALRALDPRSPFMRNWHLLWESLLQGSGLSPASLTPDYLTIALEDFPNDTDVLLAAGCRYEELWWVGSSNPRRLPSGGSSSDKHVRTAVEMLRRSVKADPAAVEPRLRLGRVLFLLDDLDGAESELRRLASPAVEPGLRYLALLFLGEVLEHRGQTAGALTSYRSAIGLVPVDQSARVAAAQLVHREGWRTEAADEIGRALGGPAAGFDPWWAYIRGQWWRFEDRLTAGRSMVRR
jgi:tetratricopeptide (TPR) repeat protein